MRKNNWMKMMAMVALVGLVGCSSGGTSSSPSESNGASPAAESDEMVTITTARPVGSDYVFVDGEDINNNVHNKWAKEKLGIDIKHLWTTADTDSYHTKLRLSLATNDQLPDVFIVQDENLIADLMQSGKVKDISVDYDKYASERIKKLYTDNQTSLNQVKKDDQLLGLPVLSSGDGTNPVLWLRQDWMEKLNLKEPKTIEDFEAIMDAFTNQDPDGNGKKDTFGFSLSGRNGYSNWMSDVSFVFGAYTGNAIPMHWYEAEDGSLKYGSVQPGAKKGLGKLQEWYKKGYLDAEFAALDETKATESFIQSKSGMIAAPAWAFGWPLGDTKKTDPNAKLRAYALPTGPDGKSARYTGFVNERKVIMFKKDFKHMDAFFNYFDKIYDYSFGTGDFKDGFFEGYDYVMVDGKPEYDAKKFPNPSEKAPTPRKYNLFWNEPGIPFQESKDWEYLSNGGEPKTRFQIQSAGSDKERQRAGALNIAMKDTNSPSLFNGSPTETMRSKSESLKTMELEAYAKIIYGKESIDSFDTFVADWKSKGGDQIEKEVNEWYKNINK
ncbi:extracellular solute-binding protein [Paenibacillus sp. GCM10023252]|uniref:extracellular solute-binding protein n=1 Tax=Paenibacillus sp. GCM10023252 TaxID=3252649 RepID=UPI00360DAF7D